MRVHTLKESLALTALTLLGATMGSLTVMLPSRFLPYVIGACALSGIAFWSFVRPVLLIYFVILVSASAGLLHSAGSLSLGSAGFTISGLGWIFIAGIAVFVVAINIRGIRFSKYFIPFILFASWVAIRWAGTLNTIGLKDVLFYSLPPLIWLYVLLVLSSSSIGLVRRIERTLLYSVLVPLLLYIILIPSGLVYLTDNGPKGVIGPRPVALYTLVILSLGLANWRYARYENQKLRGIWVSLLALGIIAFTLSRTATVIALLLLAISRLNPMRPWQLPFRGFIAAILSVSILLGVPSFRARIYHKTPSNLAEIPELVNTSGRNVMWPAALKHALEKPLLGWGPGSARPVVAKALFGEEVKVYHPHNEYLQVFHDTGAIGVGLLLLAWLPLVVRYWKRWRIAHLSGHVVQARWNMTTFLVLLLVLISITVDNTLHYAYVTLPVFIILGCTDLLNGYWRGAKPSQH